MVRPAFAVTVGAAPIIDLRVTLTFEALFENVCSCKAIHLRSDKRHDRV